MSDYGIEYVLGMLSGMLLAIMIGWLGILIFDRD
jgi:hypothetical protein